MEVYTERVRAMKDKVSEENSEESSNSSLSNNQLKQTLEACSVCVQLEAVKLREKVNSQPAN